MMARTGDRSTDGAGPGERAETARKRRFKAIIGASLVFGLVLGVAMFLAERSEGGMMTGSMSPFWAAGLAITYLLVMGSLVWISIRNADEHELFANYWGGNFGAFMYAMVYPTWLFLWKGRLVAEPDHGSLFVILLVASGAGYLYKKSR